MMSKKDVLWLLIGMSLLASMGLVNLYILATEIDYVHEINASIDK